MIGIRADGNKKIGIGHIMRCLTIAEELKLRGEEVVFFLADSSCRDIVMKRGFDYRILDTAYEWMEAELADLFVNLEELSVKALLIDSYFVTATYLNSIREKVACIYLDDMNSFVYPVNLLINYNVYAKPEDYPYAQIVEMDSNNELIKYGAEDIRLLVGPYYAPVRKEFHESRRLVFTEAKDIMITMGGSDVYNLSAKIAKRLLQTTDCKIHVVCGPFNVYREELKRLALMEERVLVHENVKEMWSLMKQCDLAVSAAGSTMCELAVAGVPTVTFSFVENQRRIAEEFNLQKAALSAGHYEKENEEAFLDKVQKLVFDLIHYPELRQGIAKKASEVVDGHGAGRIAEAIMAYSAR